VARFLGIDVGGSAARWHLRDTGTGTSLSGAESGFSGYMYRPDVLEKAKATIAGLAARIGAVDGIVAGVTGLGRDTPEADRLTELLANQLGPSRISVMNDVELAVRSVFKPGEGILIYAGTGSIGAHMDQQETLHTAGGKGVLIDDAGGGYWIAVQALRHILRMEDANPGSGWRTILGKALCEELGGNDWPTVRQSIYGRERGEIGLLALAVAAGACKGDDKALAIFRQAGDELALLAMALERRIGPQEIRLAGRAARLHPLILEGFSSALNGREIRSDFTDAAEAASRLAASLPLLTGLPLASHD
jgi:N-acetylglucosamine kinase-like BadF-type ATPase